MTTLQEGFDDISTLPSKGWVQQNNSSPLGDTNWSQGNTNISSQSGFENSYIFANYNSAGDSKTASISNWLITPVINLQNGDLVSFYTRSTRSAYPDRLQVRLSLNDSSTNVGSDATSVGDFTTLLLDINPNLTKVDYPNTFTQFKLTLSGIASPTAGRIAFRYYIPNNAGSSGTKGDYIGIDTFSYGVIPVPSESSPSLEPLLVFGLVILLVGLVVLGGLRKYLLKRG